MEMVLNNGFSEMTDEQLFDLDGGGWKSALCIFGGIVGLAWSIPVSICNPAAGMTLAGASFCAIDAAI